MKSIRFFIVSLFAMLTLAAQAQQVDVNRTVSFNEPSHREVLSPDFECPIVPGENLPSVDQPQERPIQHPNRIVASDGTSLLCDSTVTFNGDGSYIRKTIYTYNENDRKASEASYNFSNGQWVGTSKKEFVNYQEGNQTIDASASYVWKEGQWVRSSLEERAYDERGNQLLYSTWNWENDMWVGRELYQYAYDERNNKISHTWYIWSEGKWVGYSWSEYAYDEYQNQTIQAHYKWENGAWIGTHKEKVDYDSHGNIILGIHYKWHNNRWVGDIKTEWTFDDNNQITREIGYEWIENQWIESAIDMKLYAHGKEIGRIIVSHDNWQNGQWLTESTLFHPQKGNTEGADYTYKWEEDKKVEVYNSIYTPSDKWLKEHREMHVDAHWVGDGDKLEITCNGDTITTITYEWIDDLCWWDGYQAVLEKGHWGLRYHSQKKEYIYNENGDLTNLIKYYWEDFYVEKPYWKEIEQYKWEYIYDNHGNLIHKTEKSQWQNEPWKEIKDSEYIYDENDNLISEATITGSTGSKIEYTYDANGKVIGQAKYNWSNNLWIGAPTEGKWETYYPKWEYTYDDNGNKIRYADYIWSNGQWITYKETLYTYDENNLLTSVVRYQRINGVMVATSKTEYTHDKFGHETSYACYKWLNDTWIGDDKYVRTYDDLGHVTSYTHYIWSNGAWIGDYKQKNTYDDQGNMTLYVYYKWQDDQWVVSTNTVYYYLGQPKESYTMKDLNKVVDILVGKESVEEEEMEKVDINGDGVISIGDVARVIYFLINEEDDEDEDKDKKE